MKAILKIGSFTMMTDIPEQRRNWFIHAPSVRLPVTVNSLALEQVTNTPMHKRWEFEYKDTLYTDQGDTTNSILLYEFVGEA